MVVEGVGYVGFVEVGRGTSLAGLRRLLDASLAADGVPRHYQFLAPPPGGSGGGGSGAGGDAVGSGGTLVGTARERRLLAASFLPSVALVPTLESPLAGAWGARHRRAHVVGRLAL